MSTVLPQNDKIRQTIRWISAQIQENSATPKMALVNQATTRFDLSPQESEFLIQFYSRENDHAQDD